MAKRSHLLITAALFFLSGASGLVYETAWSRLFQDLFGHGVHTNAAVLAAFMAGLGLGAAIAGRFVSRVRRPILLYGALELLIVALVWTSPWQVRLVDSLIPAIAGDVWSSPLAGNVARWLLAFALVVVPTSIMGATLPLLCQGMTHKASQIGKVFGGLYGVNTLGAVVGVIAAGYWLILHFGVTGTIRIGCGLGILAGIGAIALSRLMDESSQPSNPTEEKPRNTTIPETHGDGVPRILLGVIFASGFAALAYEIVWIRTFVFILDSNILSFSMVLGTLLFALGLGSIVFPWVVRKRDHHLPALGWIQLALGLSGGSTIVLFVHFDSVVRFLQSATGSEDLLGTALGRSAITAAVLFLPGLLMGMVLPAATGALTDHRRCGRGIGLLYGANTAGNIAGSLLAGYMLIPLLGTSRTVVLLATVNILLGIVVLMTRSGGRRAPALICATACLGVVSWLWVIATPQVAREIAARRNPHASLAVMREALRGTVTVYDVPPIPILAANTDRPTVPPVSYGYRLIAVNGIDVAGTSPDLRTTQKMQAHIPMLLHGPADRVLQIGYGSGETTREALLHQPGSYHLVEINPDVVKEANHWFPEFASTGYTAFFADAKNFVRTTKNHYDVILNDSTYPGISGSSLLYSEDHFRACRQHLTENGVLSTWLPIDLPAESLRMIFSTFQTVFPNCSFWLPTNCWNKHGVLVGSVKPQEGLVDRVQHFTWPESIRSSLDELGYGDPRLFASIRVLDAEDIRILGEGVPTNSDDHPYLEYPTRGIQVAAESFWNETLRLIMQRFGPPQPVLGSSDPRAAVRLILSGQLSLLQNDPKQALHFYDQAHRAAPDHPGPAILRQDIMTFRAQAAFEDAAASINRGKSERTADLLLQAASLCPHSAIVRFEAGQAEFQRGRTTAAIPHLKACLRLSDRFPRANLLLGDAHLLSSQFGPAERAYRRYLEDHPPQFEILVALADAVAGGGRVNDAIPILERAISMSPDNQTARQMLQSFRSASATTSASAP